MKQDIFIIDAKRTPIGRYGGSLANISATELGATVIKDLLTKNPKISKHIDEVIFGNAISAGLGQNPARIAAYKSGLSYKVPAFTVNKLCGSSLTSIILGIQSINSDDSKFIIAGGMENMSLSPYLLGQYRFGAKLGNRTIRDAMVCDGLFCSLIGEHMGMTAEYLSEKYHISRKEQDVYAIQSHQKALTAIKQDRFKDEISPVSVKKGKSATLFTTDEQPRKDSTIETLSRISPAFKKNGTVTAGNASPLNDGAAAVIITSKDMVKKYNLKPIAKIKSYASVALNPRWMGLGAYYAAKKCLEKSGLKVSDIDLWEINEAFASQIIAVLKLLRIDQELVNVNGGSIALGHPISASGARILSTLLFELKKRHGRYGLASLCIGGGQGVAMLVERV